MKRTKVVEESAGEYHSGRFPGGVNFTQAYLALKYVSHQKVPTSCDEIYGLTSGTIKQNLYGQIEFIKGIRDGKYTDSYDLGPRVPVKESWPLHDIAVDCNFDEAIFANSGERVAPPETPRERTRSTSMRRNLPLNKSHFYTRIATPSTNTRALARLVAVERG